jgi:hypothetical protein
MQIEQHPECVGIAVTDTAERLLLVKNESPHIFIVSARRVAVPDSTGSPLKLSLENPIEVCWHKHVERTLKRRTGGGSAAARLATRRD